MKKSGLFIFLCAAALNVPAHAQGVAVESASPTKALTSMGQVTPDIGLYTDTSGLQPPVNLGAIALSNPGLNTPAPRPQAMAAQPAAARPQALVSSQAPESAMAGIEPASGYPGIPAAPPKKKMTNFEVYDTNHNGLISEDEFFFNAVTVRAADLFRQFDTDKSGNLSQAEFTTYSQSGKMTAASLSTRP